MGLKQSTQGFRKGVPGEQGGLPRVGRRFRLLFLLGGSLRQGGEEGDRYAALACLRLRRVQWTPVQHGFLTIHQLLDSHLPPLFSPAEQP